MTAGHKFKIIISLHYQPPSVVSSLVGALVGFMVELVAASVEVEVFITKVVLERKTVD